jgi:hypothetical protein
MKKINNNLYKNNYGELISRSKLEISSDQDLYELAKKNFPLYGENWGWHALSLIKRINISRLLFFNDIYKKILNVHGSIIEFGVHFGTLTSLLTNFRGMYEPYNNSRKIFGFDTFSGLSKIEKNKDGHIPRENDISAPKNYIDVLDKLLSIHTLNSPVPHIKKYELIKGDVCKTLGPFLNKNKQLLVSLAIFDMDIYRPTKFALKKILPRLTKGSVLVFDQLSSKEYPGESIAVDEVIGFNNLELIRTPHQSNSCYAIFKGLSRGGGKN